MKIGIALGGGGAKGFAHLGVLKALSDAGIECDLIAGTSIGALVGAIYASGGIGKINEITTKYKITDVPFLLGPTWSKKGLFNANKILKIMNDLVDENEIQDLQKSFVAVSVDLVKSEVVYFKSGDLRRAVRASIAIPALITPVAYDGKLLIDGGILEPVPVQALHDLGADIIIAVDLVSDERINAGALRVKSGEKNASKSAVNPFWDLINSIGDKLNQNKDDLSIPEKNMFDIIQRTSIVTQQRLIQCLFRDFPPDIIIRPGVADYNILDFHRGDEIIEVGKHAAIEAIPKLKRLLENQ
ncbi:MAG: patatin-like phospholipase family protein [Thermodesulfobacteriota bacterium]